MQPTQSRVEIVKNWLDALRSGRYEQGQDKLRKFFPSWPEEELNELEGLLK